MRRHDVAVGGPSRVVAAMNLVRTGVFGCLLLVGKKLTVTPLRTKVEFVVLAAQMAAFVVAPGVGLPWPEAVVPLEVAVNVFDASVLTRWYKESAYAALLYIAIAWVLLLLGLFVYGIVGFIRNKFHSLMPLRLLKLVGALSAGPLYIPLQQLVRGLRFMSRCPCELLCCGNPPPPPPPPPTAPCSCCPHCSAETSRTRTGARLTAQPRQPLCTWR